MDVQKKMIDIKEKVELPAGCPQLGTYYIYLTGGCNLACRHCWLTPKFQAHGDTGGHLEFNLFDLAIRQGLPLGLSHVKLTGGEPLLHPDFLRMVDLLKKNNLGLTIETNGTLLDKKIAHYLKEKSTLSFIAVSLDGATPESHDSFRGVKGSFEKACQAISFLVEEGFRPQVIMSIHTGNVCEAKDVVKLAEKLGAGSVKLGLVESSGRGEKMAEQNQVLDLKSLIDFGKWIEKYLQKSASIPIYYNWPAAFFSLKNLMRFDGFSCHILNILGILPTGELSICGIGSQEPELCFGRLGEDSIFDIWTSNPFLINFRKNIPDKFEGICGECIFRTRCLGSCVAHNYHLYKRITAPFWICQKADEAGIFPTSRKKRNMSPINTKLEGSI
jgi:SynChlorMet cassette radical SAM/SPASM protein ScmF